MGLFRYNGVTGHRGNPAEAPENTLDSFQNAVELGADFIETDVHRTRDGRLMLCHDADTARTCGVSMRFAEHDSAELRTLNASTDFNRNHETPYAATRIPFLEELFMLAERCPGIRLSLQPKCPYVEDICDAVKRAGMSSRIAFNDGNPEFLKTAKRLIPEALIFYDTFDAVQLTEGIELAKEYGFFGIVSHRDRMTPERVAAIRAAGLEPGVWTVNEPEEIRRFLDMGVFRIYSDFPAKVLELKETSGH